LPLQRPVVAAPVCVPPACSQALLPGWRPLRLARVTTWPAPDRLPTGRDLAFPARLAGGRHRGAAWLRPTHLRRWVHRYNHEGVSGLSDHPELADPGWAAPTGRTDGSAGCWPNRVPGPSGGWTYTWAAQPSACIPCTAESARWRLGGDCDRPVRSGAIIAKANRNALLTRSGRRISCGQAMLWLVDIGLLSSDRINNDHAH
jgi:hypothetical protein